MIANPHLFNGDKKLSNNHFFNGMMEAARNIYESANPDYPVVYYYAFKQNESFESGKSSTGWEIFS